MPDPKAALAHPNFLSEVGQIAQLVRADREAVELRQQAERAQFANAMRQDVDADVSMSNLFALQRRLRSADYAGNAFLRC
jgi:hypothetical protein